MEIKYDLLKSKHHMDVRKGNILKRLGKPTTEVGYVQCVDENGDYVISGRSYLGRKLIPEEALV